MAISSLAGSLGNRSAEMPIKEILQKNAEENLAAMRAARAETQAKAVKAENITSQPYTNVMAGNYFNKNYEKSEYTQGQIDGFQVERSFGDKLGQLVNVLSISYNQTLDELHRLRNGSPLSPTTIDPKYLAAYHESQKAKRGVTQLVGEAVTKESEKQLEESREDIADAAAEALAPKDEQGNILPGYTDVPAAAADLPDGANADVPAPAPEIADASVDVPLTGGAPGAAPANISIDITV